MAGINQFKGVRRFIVDIQWLHLTKRPWLRPKYLYFNCNFFRLIGEQLRGAITNDEPQKKFSGLHSVDTRLVSNLIYNVGKHPKCTQDLSSAILKICTDWQRSLTVCFTKYISRTLLEFVNWSCWGATGRNRVSYFRELLDSVKVYIKSTRNETSLNVCLDQHGTAVSESMFKNPTIHDPVGPLPRKFSPWGKPVLSV